MTNILHLTQQYVTQYNLENHPWTIFSQQCSQKEFLHSQEGFYYAVKAFPRMLAKLASQIESSETRLLVIDNLWEEHGHGKTNFFHTTTYFTYLQSLGFKKEQADIDHQPWVDEWIDNVLSKNYTAAQYSMYIAGIEYIYARISQFISQLMHNYILVNKQSHYANHAVLDYEHSKELIETSLLIQQESGVLSDSSMMEYFILGISEFLNLYSNMILLTEKEASIICQEKLAFYYGREDTSIAKNFLSHWSACYKKSPQVLMICSGGENAIDLLSIDNNNNQVINAMNLTLLDINPQQLQLAEKKITFIQNNHYLDDSLSIYNTGKFEKIFTFLKNRLSYQELELIAHEDINALKKLKWLCDNAFSNTTLEVIFTEHATKYSQDNFAVHFYHIFAQQISWYFKEKPAFSNIGSILFNTPPINYNVIVDNHHTVDYYHGDFLSFFNHTDNEKRTFDLIDLSNISDWMPFHEIEKIVSTAFSKLNKGGVIIGRKLLGDYQWSQLQEQLPQSSFTSVIDKTSFYKECVLIKKLDYQFIC